MNKRPQARQIAGAALLTASCVLLALSYAPSSAPAADGYTAQPRQAQVLPVAQSSAAAWLSEAPVPMLKQLPGVDEALARAICDERTENGPFWYAEDVDAVRGIGTKKLAAILEYLSEKDR